VAQRGAHVGIAQHAGELAGACVARHDLHVAGGDPALRSLRYNEVVIGEDGDLGQVRDHERLAGTAPPAGYASQRFAHSPADLAADALVDLVEDQRGHGIVLREDHLERQHQARQLTPGRDLGERAALQADVQRHREHHRLRSVPLGRREKGEA